MSVWAPVSILKDRPRRLANLRVAPEMVLSLVQCQTSGRHITQVGLPLDAELVSATYDYERRCFVLLLESLEFREVHLGAIVPDLDVMFTDHGPWEVSE